MGAALNSNVQIDPESEVPIQDQLRDILIENSVRVGLGLGLGLGLG